MELFPGSDRIGVNLSVVNRVERGENARLSTWNKLFEGLCAGKRRFYCAFAIMAPWRATDTFLATREARRRG